jgi:hypothetical protein
LPQGTQAQAVTVTATDAAGNRATATRSVRFDAGAPVTFDAGQAGGDNIISATEQRSGVTLTGTAAAGASVSVTLEGATRHVMAGRDGAWSASFSRAEVPAGTYATTASVRATDGAGNVATATHALTVDTAVQGFARTYSSAGTDGVLNGAEAAQGLVLRGTVEPGSAVTVRFGTAAARNAQVAGDGSWTLTVPSADLPSGEVSVALTMTATDRVGNVATLTEQVDVDTLVRGFARSGGAIGGDGVLNAAEVAQGLPQAVAGASGQWSLAFAAADLPQGEVSVTAQLTATDRAGNVASLTETFRVDTSGGETPDVVSVVRDAHGLRAIGTELTADTVNFARIDAAGSAVTLAATRSDDAVFGETNFRFASTVPDGSYLVINTADAAGNQSNTLLVAEDASGAVVNLDRAGLAGFDFGTIDLNFAPSAQLSITSAQLQALTGPDQRLVVKGGADDSVTLSGGIDTGQTAEIDGERYAIFTLGASGAAVLLDDDIRTVT